MRQRNKYLFLLSLVVGVVIVVLLAAIPGAPIHKSPTLGLDLRGGLEIVLEAVPPKGRKLTSDDLDRSVTVMRNRIDKLGVSEPEVRKQEPNQIVIQLAGVHDTQQAADIVGQTAQLELYDLEGDLTGPSINAAGQPIATARLYDLLAGQQKKAAKGSPEAWYVFRNKSLARNGGPFFTKAEADKRRDQLIAAAKNAGGGSAGTPSGTNGGTGGSSSGGAKKKATPASFKILAVPEHTIAISCTPSFDKKGNSLRICPGVQSGTATYWYLFKHDLAKGIPELTGNELKGSGIRADFDPLRGNFVNLAFSAKGDRAFQRVTRTLYQRGNFRQAPQHFAVILDNEIITWPQIDYTDSSLSNGIAGGGVIEGIGTAREAKDIALVLQTGALPVTFKQVDRTDVSATLGKDSLNQAKNAALIGLIVVAVFLLLIYRFLGLVAVIGLAIYAAFLYGAILALNVTLTLPGFAGLILTIGVAADANIVIFERIKEEVRSGKSVRAAIATGYQKGFHTIIDANVVTCITALILFAVATAQVRGFALMLLIGTVLSLVTAVAATRALLGLLAGFRWFENPNFMGAKGQQHGKWLQIDFMRRRYTWFAISGVVVLVAVISLAVQGLNLGIDFKGGSQITFKTPAYVPLDKVRSEAAKIGQGEAIVQGKGQSQGDSYKSFQLRTKSLSSQNQDRLTQGLRDDLKATSIGVRNVSSSFGAQILRLAILAIIVSLVLIVAYIALRFDRKYGIPVIVSLAHDLVITIGIYSLVQREVSTSTVAAVLTVLGYSIYDTIIIFDRIRENTPNMRRASYATIANVSLWETIRRSLATTFITLLPVLSLLLFGGETLKDFALALLVGIGAGAYSSIFIAAPLLTIFKEREPEFRRRIGSTAIDRGIGGAGDALPEGPAAPAPVPVAAVGAGYEPEGDEQERDGDDGVGAALPKPPTPAGGNGGDGAARTSDSSKREQRRQRRSSRPHGRAR